MLQTILRHGIERARLVHVGEMSRFAACLARKEISTHPVEVRNPRITEIDIAEEPGTGVEPWAKGFPEAQRAPAKPRPEPETKAEPPPETPSRPAKPSH
jgi:hypothetical protein